jgi:hypothetical protein
MFFKTEKIRQTESGKRVKEIKATQKHLDGIAEWLRVHLGRPRYKRNYNIQLDPEEIAPHIANWIRVSQY